MPQDPSGFSDALGSLDPPPVKVEPKKKPSKKRSKTVNPEPKAKEKKAKTSKPKQASRPASPARAASGENVYAIISSFEKHYQEVIRKLPKMFWPTSSKHGKHSYTATLDVDSGQQVSIKKRFCFQR